jgi:formate dehydrogenase alpha subunit
MTGGSTGHGRHRKKAMPLLTINGIETEAREGATILEAAEGAGIWIPTFCYYPKISPSDSCRVCVVEVEGFDRPVTSCNTVAKDGMRVSTDTPRLQTMREEVMKLILMDHPLDCPVCPAAGACHIQNVTYRLGIHGTDFPLQARTAPVVSNWPLIEYNLNLCISCGRCVKVCHEVIGADALALKGTGYETRVDTVGGEVLNCEFCGECVEACPAGALSMKGDRGWARAWELRHVSSVCPLCSAGCRLILNVKNGRVISTGSDLETHNRGTLCAGGRFGLGFTTHEDRLVSPLIRRNGELVPVPYEEAVSFVTEKLRGIIDEHGPESVVGLASPRLTNEDCYAFQKLFRAVIGSNSIDSEARFRYLRVQRAFELTSRTTGTTGTIDDLLQTEAIFIIGTDPIEETPAIGWKIKTAARRHDCKVVVANSRKTSLDRFAMVRMRIRPYSESELALGLMKIILDDDLWDKDFVLQKTTHFLPLKNLLDKIPLSGILRRTGVSEEDLTQAAHLLAQAAGAAIIFGGDVIQQADGLQCAMNLANLALLTGNVGRSDAGIYPVFEKGNVLGLCDMGVLPEHLPGYQDTARARDLFEGVWRTSLPYTKGRTVHEMVLGLEKGAVKAVYLAGADPLTDYPNSDRFAAALDKADLLIAQDIFLSPSAAKAHCVLPSAAFTEIDGTITNIEHRTQRLTQAVTPPGDARPDWTMFEDIARGLGRSMGYFSVRDVFSDIAQTVPFYRGLRMRDMEGDGRIVRPKRDEQITGPSDKPYSFAPVRTWEDPIGPDTEEYPFELMAGRSKFHFGSLTTRSQSLLQLAPEAHVEVNHKDAARLNIKDGDIVEVVSPNGSFRAPARATDTVAEGMLFAPVDFPDSPVYRLFEENTTLCRVRLTRTADSK